MKHLEEIKKLLDQIHENPQVTQRELVNKIDISLGKVNFLLKALTKKGIVKIKTFRTCRNKRGYMYLITPQGLKEKMQITREFLKRKLEEYHKLEEDIKILELTIHETNKDKVNGKDYGYKR